MSIYFMSLPMGTGSAYLNGVMAEYQNPDDEDDYEDAFDVAMRQYEYNRNQMKSRLAGILENDHILKSDNTKSFYTPESGIMLDESLAEMLWLQYTQAMGRRERFHILSKQKFVNHVRHHSYYFHHEGSYVFGNYDEYSGIFTVTHFAPRTIKEGSALIRYLSNATNVVFAVTEDLKSMIERLGFQDLGIQLPRRFGSEIVMKHILVSDPHYIYEHLDRIIESYGFDSNGLF